MKTLLHSTVIKRIIRECYKQLLPNKTDNLDETEKLLEIDKLPKLTQEEIENLNRPIKNKDMESTHTQKFH